MTPRIKTLFALVSNAKGKVPVIMEFGFIGPFPGRAGTVDKRLEKKDLGTTEFPPIETTLIDGDVAFGQHGGGHTTGPNWHTFLTFADRYFTK